MKGTWAHAGFPEIQFDKYSHDIVQLGYKVVCVEQMETPEMMEARCRSMVHPTKFDRVVRREVCRIISKGTETFSIMDSDFVETHNRYLICMKEKVDYSANLCRTYGVCFVDTTVGKFYVGQMTATVQGLELFWLIMFLCRSFLSEENPHQKRKRYSDLLSSTVQEGLIAGSQFWNASKTLKTLIEEDYFQDREDTGSLILPPVIRSMTAKSDSLGLTPRENSELALSAHGDCVFYLKKCIIDQELLTFAKFEEYIPVDLDIAKEPESSNLFANDKALADISDVEERLHQYLEKQCKQLGCKAMMYWGAGRNRYQMEIAETAVPQNLPDEYMLKSSRKGYKRYWTKDIEKMIDFI